MSLEKLLLVRIEGDSTDLVKEAKAGGKALDALGDRAVAAGAKIDGGLSKGESVFARFAKGVNTAANALAPYNQALELGGKALRVVVAGLDEYGKTSAAAAAQVKALTDEVNGYKTSALQAVGEVTVGVLGAIPPINQMKQAWVNAQVQTDDFFDMLERRANEDAWKDAFGSFFSEFERVQMKAGSDEDALLKQQRSIATAAGLPDAIKLTLTNLKGAVEWSGIGEKLSGLADGLDKAADKAKRAREEAAGFRKEIAALASKNAKDAGDAVVAQLEASMKPYRGYEQSAYGPAAFEKNAQRFAGLNIGTSLGIMPGERPGTPINGESGQSFLARALGPLNEFDAYATAFQGLGDTAGSAFEAIATGSGSIGQVIRDGAKQTLLALGKEEAVQSLKELAWGFSQLASGPLGAAVAPLHFKSAAIHGAAAVAAGVGVAALGSIGGGGAPAGGGGYTGGGGGYTGGAPSTQTKTTVVNNYIVQGDSFSDDSPRIRQQQAERVVTLGMARAQPIAGAF